LTKSTYADLLRAAHFAAEKHRFQKRKDEAASPYINHPLAVAEVLARHGVDDPVALRAALLHDTIEDTATTPEELRSLFGPEVCTVVQDVSDDKSLPKERRKELQIQHAPGLSVRAKLVKLGDKICNVRDVALNPPAGWSLERRQEYLDWTEAVVEGCRGVNRDLEACYDQALAEARTAIDAASRSKEV
jgi:guanosine-3',5'-bis(diphosphate) 3'-pyrophosphohydrolase